MLISFATTSLGVVQKDSCYSEEEVKKLSGLVVKYDTCVFELNEKNKLISQSLQKFDAGPAWWQAPSVVFGGVVVSFAAGATITYILVRDRLE